MKTFKQNYRGFLTMAAVSATLMLAGASQSFADNGYRNGYRNYHHPSHNYTNYHHHRGYWDNRNGVRVWITI